MSTLEWESHWTRGMIPEILLQLYCDLLYFWNRELTKSVIGIRDRKFQDSRQDQRSLRHDYMEWQSSGASMIMTLTLNHRHHWELGMELRAALSIDSSGKQCVWKRNRDHIVVCHRPCGGVCQSAALWWIVKCEVECTNLSSGMTTGIRSEVLDID
jgi:hypothetical protein